jgi:hypothetical protein
MGYVQLPESHLDLKSFETTSWGAVFDRSSFVAHCR